MCSQHARGQSRQDLNAAKCDTTRCKHSKPRPMRTLARAQAHSAAVILHLEDVAIHCAGQEGQARSWAAARLQRQAGNAAWQARLRQDRQPAGNRGSQRPTMRMMDWATMLRKGRGFETAHDMHRKSWPARGSEGGGKRVRRMQHEQGAAAPAWQASVPVPPQQVIQHALPGPAHDAA